MSTKKRSARKRRGLLQQYFIPGEHNAHRPLFLEVEAFLVNAAIIALLFLVAFGLQKLVTTNSSKQVGAVVASVLVDLANDDRAGSGLRTLAVNPVLQKAAQMKADDMAAKAYFAHDTPEGFDPWHWFKKAGYGFQSAGENLAVYFSDSSEVEKAWMNSPTHRANILNPSYREIGIALARGSYQGVETTFVVQMFGNPAEASAVIVESREPSDVTSTSTVAGASAKTEPLAARGEQVQPIGAVTGRSSSNTFWKVITAPRTTLQYIYMALAALVLLAIGLLFLVELKRLHVPGLLRGLGLLALIGVLLWSSSLFSAQLLIL